MRRTASVAAAVVAALLALVWAMNSSMLAPEPAGQIHWLAHRGVHQTFSLEGVDNDTCTATRIDPPLHGYLENTIPSMRAAFDAAATTLGSSTAMGARRSTPFTRTLSATPNGRL